MTDTMLAARSTECALIHDIDKVGIGQLLGIHTDAIENQSPATWSIRFAKSHIAGGVQMPTHKTESASTDDVCVCLNMHGKNLALIELVIDSRNDRGVRETSRD